MEAAASNSRGSERVSFRKLLWVGPLAIVAAVVVNVVIWSVSVALFGLTDFPPLALGSTITILFTVFGVLGAVVVFALVARFSRRSIRLFKRIALVALLVTLVPDVLLLVAPTIPGTRLPGVLTLMTEHVAAWAISVGALTTISVERTAR